VDIGRYGDKGGRKGEGRKEDGGKGEKARDDINKPRRHLVH